MAIEYKSHIRTSSATGSKIDFFTCPAGKTAVFKTIIMYNNDTNNNAQTTYLLDHSNDTSNSYALGDPDGYTIPSGSNTSWTTPIVLEENDMIKFQNDQDSQFYYGSYVLMDNAGNTRFKHITKKITSEDAYSTIYTCPTGSRAILKYWQITNAHGSNNATGNILAYVDASTDPDTFVYLSFGTINSSAIAYDGSRTYNFNAGDSLQIYNTEQPFIITAFFMEMPVPSIRGQ
tara:strand:+ start:103 stop:798 length:696 start_codon:yes stop_codon:yes gene_type:complete